ncbi:hypothetical protein V6N11_081648 [Hibiscus sabdariffa]|uniref:Uncharacterized protein n=1 Tax=Hibiscus sabdariffa TaxID=183260 RepID=A0ABR2N8R1_9ROSI
MVVAHRADDGQRRPAAVRAAAKYKVNPDDPVHLTDPPQTQGSTRFTARTGHAWPSIRVASTQLLQAC